MRSTSRLVAATSGGLLLAAVIATPALAHSGETDSAGTRSTSGHGMAQMYEQMMGDNPGMAQMHEQMMANPDAAHAACDQS